MTFNEEEEVEEEAAEEETEEEEEEEKQLEGRQGGYRCDKAATQLGLLVSHSLTLWNLHCCISAAGGV